jgi:hypothetical protein
MNNNLQQELQQNLIDMNYVKQNIKAQVNPQYIQELETAIKIHRNPLSSAQEVRIIFNLYKYLILFL